MITTTYRVNVTMPEGVYGSDMDKPDISRKLHEILKYADASGINSYSDTEVWADFTDISMARACDYNLQHMARTMRVY